MSNNKLTNLETRDIEILIQGGEREWLIYFKAMRDK